MTKALKPSDIVKEMNAALGTGTIKLGSDPTLVVKYLATGVLPLDILLGGGLPRGRCTEIFGAPSTLKSYVALRAIATAQNDNGICALIDTEHSYDPGWLEALGGRPEELILHQPETGEEAVVLVETLLRNGADLLVWDSVAATQTKQHREKKPGEDNQPGSQARFMSAALRRLTAANQSQGTAMLWINQTRQKIGITWGSPETTPGGKALPFYASFRLKFTRTAHVTSDIQVFDTEKFVRAKQTDAYKIKVVLEKSKLNKPHREAWFVFDLSSGMVDDLGFLVSQAIEQGVVEIPSGSRFKLPHWSSTVHGIKKFRQTLEGSVEDVEWLTDQLMGNPRLMSSRTKSAQRRKKKGARGR